MIAVDSSVVVAACATWHEAHDVARRALDRRPRLVAHCALEAYSVLSRLPPPHRIAGSLIVTFLDDRFADDPLTLPASRLRGLASELHAAGITGGAVYDALVAVSAASHDATLLTLDRRAEQTYQRCSARYELLANVA